MAGTVETLTLDQFSGEMARVAAELGPGVSFEKPLKQCRLLVIADVKENFAGGHGPDGSAWPPLKHARANSKGADKPLRDEGMLMASVTSANGAGHVEELTDSYLVLGTNLDYARVHQEGGTIRPKGHPFLAIPLTREADRAGSPRDFGAELVPVIKNGKGILLERREGRRGVEEIAQYALVQSVVIPARPFLGFSQKVIEKIVLAFADFARRLLGGR